LIEAAKMTDARCGDVEVSPRNANFFVAGPRAKARDVLDLMELIQQGVAQKMGVELEPAIEIW
jgi:UDP-N-acetylenolpyruvoylglucosamine reductase